MDVRGLFFGLVLAALTVLTVAIFRPFLTYLLAAVLLAFALYPAHARLSEVVGQHVSALTVVIAAVLAFVGVAYLFVVALPADAASLVEGIEQVPAVETIENGLERRFGVAVPLESTLAAVPEQFADLLAARASGLVGLAVHSFLGLLLLGFVVYYLLVDGEDLLEWFETAIPLEPQVQTRLRAEADEVTWAVLKGHVLVAVVQGIVAGVGLWIVGVPNVTFWTLVMIFLEFFPVVGVAAVLGPAVAYLALVDRLLAAGFLAVYGLSAVALIDDYLRAIVVDHQSSLHSAVILIGVFGGVYVFGVVGLFVGPIVLGLFGAAVTVFDEYYAPS